MTDPLYNRDLGQRAHRLLWWLLANQERDAKGIPTGLVSDGWRERACTELSLARNHVWKAQSELEQAGVIELVGEQKVRKRSVKINGDAFKG